MPHNGTAAQSERERQLRSPHPARYLSPPELIKNEPAEEGGKEGGRKQREGGSALSAAEDGGTENGFCFGQ